MSQAENNDKIKKYIPYGLGIVTILLVIVILTVGSQNLSKRQSVTVGTTASTTTHQCTKSDWTFKNSSLYFLKTNLAEVMNSYKWQKIYKFYS